MILASNFMPIIKSAIKRTKQAEKRRQRNIAIKSAVKRDIRSVTDAVDAKAASSALAEAMSEIDRAVKRGVLHKNTAARRKSRLSRLVTALGPAPKGSKSSKPTEKPKDATTAKPSTSKPKSTKSASTKKPAVKKTTQTKKSAKS